MKIYLSPSNQPSNIYAFGNTTEKEQMEALGKIIQKQMEAYEVSTLMASFNLHINKDQRPTEAFEADCDISEAIHSNAGGGGTGFGAVVFYHPDHPISKKLAEAIVRCLNAITPYGENRGAQVVNGMTALDGKSMGEIRSYEEFGIIPVLIEVDFHDNPKTAEYIINNKVQIASAIVRANVETFNLKRKTVVVAPQAPTPIVVEELHGSVKVIYSGSDGLNVRTSPDFGKNIVQMINEDEVFTVVGKIGDFYKLKSGLYISNNPKFVKFRPVVVFDEYLVRVSVPALNIRKEPDFNSPPIGNVKEGGAYTIVGEHEGWGRLKSGAGWISLRYTTRIVNK